MNREKSIINWLIYLIILLGTMYLGAHVLAYIIYKA